jgi:LytS/YehU family sensor histidine kinase
LLLVSFIVFKIFQIQRNKEERKKELVILENKFFRSQLNPHFIFNALLAIQSFIYKKEPDEAVRYLTSFAKLIRYILSIADEESISLDKELQFVRNYLELQRLRFSNKFEYKINIEKNLNPEMIQVPPLLAQPFIENAIEHGIQYKPEKGKLDINMFSDNHDLIMEVVDDGIGREASQRLYAKRSDKPKSYGISIIEQRIALMNKIMDNNIKIRIEDLVNQEGPVGTKVNIRIPFINNQ